MKLSDFHKEVWLALFNEGGYWTAEELAGKVKADSMTVFKALNSMERRGLLMKRKSQFQRRLNYGIEGTCLVPLGMTVAEVQA